MAHACALQRHMRALLVSLQPLIWPVWLAAEPALVGRATPTLLAQGAAVGRVMHLHQQPAEQLELFCTPSPSCVAGVGIRTPRT
jgi:hypothetical protein